MHCTLKLANLALDYNFYILSNQSEFNLKNVIALSLKIFAITFLKKILCLNNIYNLLVKNFVYIKSKIMQK